jgi:hypothetical protein
MYGSQSYAAIPYGADNAGAGGESIGIAVEPPLVSAAFSAYAPAVSFLDGEIIEAPLIASTMLVFPPASVAPRGRPIAEDIRIMRVRRSE